MSEQLIFEKSMPGRKGISLPADDLRDESLDTIIPTKYRAVEAPILPETSQPQVIRHYTRLSRMNMGIDTSFYPLGSCSMKFNPRINEHIAGFKGFRDLHPEQDENTLQGLLQLLYETQHLLGDITGMGGITLQPAAGAHGELTGLLIAAAYFKSRGEHRTRALIPDTAHGTNPASATRAGFSAVKIPSNNKGRIDLEALRKILNRDTACLMLTNPNTLGLFEKDVIEIANAVHEQGGLLYMDGANFNALMGIARPGDFGVDILHLNLHKTFSTPHGTGGPGSGPVAVADHLIEYLPCPQIKKKPEGTYYLDYDCRKSIGKVRSFFGNIPPVIKAFTYILSQGCNGLEKATRIAVVNANYLLSLVEDVFDVPFGRRCMHEFVASSKKYKAQNIRALDVAKALLDYGFHPPTVYFPLIVEEALMVEPTETETKETLEAFADAIHEIVGHINDSPEKVRGAPTTMPVKRLDEYRAARYPVLRWKK